MKCFPVPTPWNRILTAGGCLLVVVAVGFFVKLLHEIPSQRVEPVSRGNVSDTPIQRYRDQLAIAPQNHAARLHLAKLLKPVDAASALEELQKIPAEAAEYPEAVWHIAHIATVGRQDDLAEQSLLKLNELRPNDLGVVLSLAELYDRTERPAEALPWVEQAAAIEPQRAETWLFLSAILQSLNRPGEMLKPLQKAVELNAELYPAHANLVFALQFAGQPESAIREARWCLDRQSQDTAVRRGLAMALRDQGEHDAALREIRLALAIEPDNVDCRIVEADLLLFRREAEDAYNALIAFYPASANRRDFLGSLERAAAMSGRKEESRRYQQAINDLINQELPLKPLSNEVNPSEAVP